jgi:hypothetical protein
MAFRQSSFQLILTKRMIIGVQLSVKQFTHPRFNGIWQFACQGDERFTRWHGSILFRNKNVGNKGLKLLKRGSITAGKCPIKLFLFTPPIANIPSMRRPNIDRRRLIVPSLKLAYNKTRLD